MIKNLFALDHFGDVLDITITITVMIIKNRIVSLFVFPYVFYHGN